MASVFASHRSLEALAALEQRQNGLRLTEIAEAVAAPVSSTQVALGLLTDYGLVSIGTRRPRMYQIAPGQQADAARILEVACRRDPDGRLLAGALRANRAVEFAARDEIGLLLVISWDAEPSDEVRLNRMLARLGMPITRFGHDEVREVLLDDPSLRERARRSETIVGSADRSFPDPFRHGSPEAPLLGHLHPMISRPSRNALRRFARRFGLSEVRVFGSAVHADFRPDSDIDVMVRRKRGARRTLEAEVALRRDLEDLFGRDVDVVDASLAREGMRQRAESDGVVLYG